MHIPICFSYETSLVLKLSGGLHRAHPNETRRVARLVQVLAPEIGLRLGLGLFAVSISSLVFPEIFLT